MKKTLTFLTLGIIGAAAALFLEIIFSLAFPTQVAVQEYFERFTGLLLLVVLIEEFFKVSFLWKSLAFTPKIDLPLGGLILGIGFGLSELVLKNIFWSEAFSLGQLSALLVHILTASLSGYLLSRSFLSEKSLVFLSFLISTFLHLSYNLAIIHLFS
ncbi:MAG: hypothetical protein ACOYS2_00970 [Patescibacteria group bacterium]